jgi:hypothetical protein
MYTANFEDSVFILNMRIRLIRDTLRLNPPPDLFLEKSLDDLHFIDNVLISLAQALADEKCQSDQNEVVDFLLDTEWQFSQLLIEFSLDSSPFSLRDFPQTRDKISLLRESNDARRKVLEETYIHIDDIQSEPVVTSAELTSLLGDR